MQVDGVESKLVTLPIAGTQSSLEQLTAQDTLTESDVTVSQASENGLGITAGALGAQARIRNQAQGNAITNSDLLTMQQVQSSTSPQKPQIIIPMPSFSPSALMHFLLFEFFADLKKVLQNLAHCLQILELIHLIYLQAV